MIKALWLTSWYPNELNKFNGDFVQRQAYATSLFCKVNVIHLEADVRNVIHNPVVYKKTQRENLTETIVLYKPSSAIIIGKLISYNRYKKIFKRLILDYITENGVPDVVHVHVIMKAGLLALWMKKKFGIKYIITEHSTMFTGNGEDAFNKRSFVFKNQTKEILKNSLLSLPVSKNLGEAINAIIPIRFTVVYNCVNTDYFFYKDDIEVNNFTFIHVSTLNEKKNPEAIIDAFLHFNKKHPQTKLIIVGELNATFSNYIKRLDFLPHVIHFAGLVSYENVAQYMQKSNAFILFSRRENMPCVILEALCCGLPVISSDAGGINEVINQENGLLVSNYSTESLLQAMTEIYNNYQFYNRKKIAEAAQVNFSYNQIGKEITEKYKEILKETAITS